MNDRPRRVPHTATVQRTEQLSPSLVRLVVAGAGMERFEPSPHADSYVKVLVEERMRSYTVRAFDPATRELTLDFVVHGDEGVAGPWAAAARPGDELSFLGPGGGYSPDPTAQFHLLAGDLSALPAIAVTLEALPADAVGTAFVEVHDEGDRLALDAPVGVPVVWLDQGDRAPGETLVEAVRTMPWPDGDVQGFVHGEAGAMRALRHYLRIERGLPLERLSVSGYWRLGDDDEAWRAGKRDWNAAIEADEQPADQPADQPGGQVSRQDSGALR